MGAERPDWTQKGGYRRVKTPVTLAQAKERLIAYRNALKGSDRLRLWNAAWLARVIWPDAKFGNHQGAGRCAGSLLTRIGCRWTSRGDIDRGWDLYSLK
jgi:hypothetical protein